MTKSSSGNQTFKKPLKAKQAATVLFAFVCSAAAICSPIGSLSAQSYTISASPRLLCTNAIRQRLAGSSQSSDGQAPVDSSQFSNGQTPENSSQSPDGQATEQAPGKTDPAQDIEKTNNTVKVSASVSLAKDQTSAKVTWKKTGDGEKSDVGQKPKQKSSLV